LQVCGRQGHAFSGYARPHRGLALSLRPSRCASSGLVRPLRRHALAVRSSYPPAAFLKNNIYAGNAEKYFTA